MVKSMTSFTFGDHADSFAFPDSVWDDESVSLLLAFLALATNNGRKFSFEGRASESLEISMTGSEFKILTRDRDGEGDTE